MTTAERNRRRILRKRAKAKRARQLFREYVANRKREWDARVEAAEQSAEYARRKQRHAEDQFSKLMSLVLSVAPDFPMQDVLREAPDYIARSYRISQARHKEPRGWMDRATDFDLLLGNERTMETFFYVLEGYLDTAAGKNNFQRVMAFRLKHINSDKSVGTNVMISDFALRSSISLEFYLSEVFRKVAQNMIRHMQGRPDTNVRTEEETVAR